MKTKELFCDFKEQGLVEMPENLISFIIPTYNRSRYLHRCLSYYNSYKLKHKIIIADSSSDNIKELNKNTINTFPYLNIQLIHYPPEICPQIKLIEALKYHDAKYCLIIPDDDFFTPNGIYQAVDFLEKNPDYTVAQGYQISYMLDDVKQQRYIKPIPYLAAPSLTSSDAVDRFRCHFVTYHPTFYGIQRTDFLRMLFGETVKHTDDYRFGELLPSMLSAIYGKIKCLDLLYGVRECSKTSGGHTFKKIPDFIKEGTYDYKYARFRDCLTRHLFANSSITETEAAKVIDDAMYTYCMFHFGCLKDKDKLKKLSIYDKLFLPMVKLKEQFGSSIEDPSSKYYDDFDRIRKHIFSHHSRTPVC